LSPRKGDLHGNAGSANGSLDAIGVDAYEDGFTELRCGSLLNRQVEDFEKPVCDDIEDMVLDVVEAGELASEGLLLGQARCASPVHLTRNDIGDI
jgi:hypothetical protein